MITNNLQILGLLLTQVCFLLVRCWGGPGWGDSRCCLHPLSGPPAWRHSPHLETCRSPWQRAECPGGFCLALVNVPAGSHVQDSCSHSRGQRPSRGGQRPAMCSEVSKHEELGEQSSTSEWPSSRSRLFAILNASLNMPI